MQCGLWVILPNRSAAAGLWGGADHREGKPREGGDLKGFPQGAASGDQQFLPTGTHGGLRSLQPS